MIRLIAAIDQKRGIAKDGEMPWDIPEDEAYFTSQTKKYGGQVLTGSKTFELAYKNKPLADRHNYILTHKSVEILGATVVNELKEFLEKMNRDQLDVWVAGGAVVFEQVMKLGFADELYLTEIDADYKCDQFFPAYKSDFKLVNDSGLRQQNGHKFAYKIYSK